MRAIIVLAVLLAVPGVVRTQENGEGAETRTINAFVGQTVIIPVENPDTVQVERRDILDYVLDLSPEETRPILTARDDGTTRVLVTKEGKQTIFVVRVQDPEQVDQAQVIKNLVGDPGLDVVYVGNNIVLQGDVANDFVYRKALNIANSFTPNIFNFMNIKEPTQIRLKVHIISVDVNKAKNIGLQYGQGTVNAAGEVVNNGLALPFDILTDTTAPYFKAYNALLGRDFNATLNLAESEGLIKILQEPTITVINGQSAVFRVGGEFPIETATVDNGVVEVDVEYRPFGISLLVAPVLEEYGGLNEAIYQSMVQTPANQSKGLREAPNLPMETAATVMENGMIKVFIRPEVSALDYTLVESGDANFPTIRNRYVETRVMMKDGQPLVLGGLFDETDQKQLQKVPFISKVPILGEMFKNRDNTNTRQELVFILIPEILKGDRYVNRNDLAQYNPKEPAMVQHLIDTDVKLLAAKPTRISADEVRVRNGEIVPQARPLSMPAVEALPLQMSVDEAERRSVEGGGMTVEPVPAAETPAETAPAGAGPTMRQMELEIMPRAAE